MIAPTDDPRAGLTAFLNPLMRRLVELDPATRESETAQQALLKTLEAEFPGDGPFCRELGERLPESLRKVDSRLFTTLVKATAKFPKWVGKMTSRLEGWRAT